MTTEPRIDFGAGTGANEAVTGWTAPVLAFQTTTNGTGMGVYGAATGIGIQANGGGGAHNVVQPFQAVNWFIKT